VKKMLELFQNVFVFKGSVNLVYIKSENGGILLDAALDEQRMKKVLKEIEKRGWEVTHTILTHAHADHFGGAAWLQKNREIITYAAPIEASIMQSPVLEPIYLFGGAKPLDELRNKFLEGRPIHIDQVIKEGTLTIDGIHFILYLLPGHSYYQLGVGVENILLYAADSYFSKEVLDKHGVPFIIDAKETMDSLKKLQTISSYLYYLPGHGEAEENIKETVEANLRRHQEILTIIDTFIEIEGKVSLEEILAHVLTQFRLESKNLASWLLYRTSILAYVRCLIETKRVGFTLFQNQLLFFQAFDAD
jgi:glyoxylase-like metal-dependent hydrolase (beta-lactamase superfamily II)